MLVFVGFSRSKNALARRLFADHAPSRAKRKATLGDVITAPHAQLLSFDVGQAFFGGSRDMGGE
jgi:hypothetical protein